MKKNIFKETGFTLAEIVVSISLFLIIILMVSSIYSIVQKAYNQGSNEAELLQNARVTLDRMSRELRQSVKIVTSLPVSENDPLIPPINSIQFQDGHDLSQISYIRYYLDGTSLKRSQIGYYFNSDPTTYVYWNSVDVGGGPPVEVVLNSSVVGEYFEDLNFWGSAGVINISISLQKNQKKFHVNSSVFTRN
ncbi:MAG: hypothetical protein UT48_C0004G0011 [Parcubacteria group bacterium GW2011_GWE2_39_37]|uniref:Prepilin-type N-terminal cleavage/methylation domain-containing protein n=1 Tax=Candidatus Falkowbacteria bacterium GW2011_GWF2_39_8 TaxID=1618642 RepID=A0A0G0S8W0_9BACT|nr:MAG: hypothetical protein UT48_C0004G0011 [Parcubacteria group bacterium GW2011_GWE2_39_37]KKR31180.1 MAG: hypothetical protein UT64_C0070G0008 [Candidatus Falkowbacteria bacterium GW2011_GWF2_39_8]